MLLKRTEVSMQEIVHVSLTWGRKWLVSLTWHWKRKFKCDENTIKRTRCVRDNWSTDRPPFFSITMRAACRTIKTIIIIHLVCRMLDDRNYFFYSFVCFLQNTSWKNQIFLALFNRKPSHHIPPRAFTQYARIHRHDEKIQQSVRASKTLGAYVPADMRRKSRVEISRQNIQRFDIFPYSAPAKHNKNRYSGIT